MKILIIGEGRHGKDTLADWLHEMTGLRPMSSSRFACDEFIFKRLRGVYGYATADECYADRHQHRELWYDLICEYNRADPARLARGLLVDHQIYVGMRDDVEFNHAKGMFDLIVAVDASDRVPELDETLKISLLAAHVHLTNNGTEEEFMAKARHLANMIMDRMASEQG